MRSKSVPQRVRMHFLVDASQPGRFSASAENGSGGERATGLGSGEEPAGGALPPPVGDQHFAQRLTELYLPILTALAAPYPDHPTAAVQVLYVEVGRFRYAEPGAIQRGQHRPVCQVF